MPVLERSLRRDQGLGSGGPGQDRFLKKDFGRCTKVLILGCERTRVADRAAGPVGRVGNELPAGKAAAAATRAHILRVCRGVSAKNLSPSAPRSASPTPRNRATTCPGGRDAPLLEGLPPLPFARGHR